MRPDEATIKDAMKNGFWHYVYSWIHKGFRKEFVNPKTCGIRLDPKGNYFILNNVSWNALDDYGMNWGLTKNDFYMEEGQE